jgi:hypothetical protein
MKLTNQVLKIKLPANISMDRRIETINGYIAELTAPFHMASAFQDSQRSAINRISNPKMAAAIAILAKNNISPTHTQSYLIQEIGMYFGFSKTQFHAALYRWRQKQKAKMAVIARSQIPTTAVWPPVSTMKKEQCCSEHVSIRRLIALPACIARIPKPKHKRRIASNRERIDSTLPFEAKLLNSSPHQFHQWAFSPPQTNLHSVFGFDTHATGPPRIRIHALEFG